MENPAFDNVAREIRHRLYSDEFRCLSSFLFNLAEQCCADEAGVVSVSGNRLIKRRSAGLKAAFNEIEFVLRSELVENIQPLRRPQYSRCVWIQSLNENLILRRIWPAEAWQKAPREAFWLYVHNPKAVVSPKHSADDELVVHFGGLASAFIRWKNEVFALHDELLARPFVDTDKVLKEFRRLIVRPVLPVHFQAILSRFTPDPKKLSPFAWASEIEKIRYQCVKPSTCRCFCSTMPDGKQSFPCPQTEEIDRVLNIMGRLEYWRTDFWKQTGNDVKEKRHGLLKEGVQGLEDAAVALHWQDVERKSPIDFSEGANAPAGERALLRHFCAHAISKALQTDGGKTWNHPDTHPSKLEFPAKLASLASTLLGDGHWTPDAIENLLQTVALFGHCVLNIPERVDLVRHLKQTLRGETALHTLKSRYRDHFFHTLEVCFIGFALLTSRPDSASEQTFADRLLNECREYWKGLKDTDKLPPLPQDANELLAQWWTAALVHDTAYGIDIFSGTLELLEFFTNREEVKTFLGKARGTVGDMAEKLTGIAPELQGAPIKQGDHGVLAAASLTEVLKNIGPTTGNRFLPAVRAIAFHNTRHPQVDAGVDPVAALLILCDTVQEWGRSSLGFDRSPSVLLSRMMEASLTPQEEQFGPVKRYGLSLQASGDANLGDYHWKDAGRLLIELDYGDESLKGCKAKFTWADMTYNLQRVDFRAWGVDLRVQVSVPFPKPQEGIASIEPMRKTKSQFDHFGSFIEEQEVRFIERWFTTACERNPDRAVCHRVARRDAEKNIWEDSPHDSLDARELITFNLVELGKEFKAEAPMMGGRVGDFFKAISKWSVFVREQADEPPAQRPPV